jgi:hypothetical protein
MLILIEMMLFNYEDSDDYDDYDDYDDDSDDDDDDDNTLFGRYPR